MKMIRQHQQYAEIDDIAIRRILFASSEDISLTIIIPDI